MAEMVAVDPTQQPPLEQDVDGRWQETAVLVAGLAFSLLALWHVGRLGFQFEDLSIPFDGGYRIWLGQRPYVDFMAPTGPVLYLQQALFFALFGVSIATYLLHAAVLNSLAGVMAWRLLARRGYLLAGVATVTTWCWFYLPPGAPYIDTTAFFWTLVGWWALAEGRGLIDRQSLSVASWRRRSMLVLSGSAASLAFLTKQNIGGLAVGGLALLLILDLRDRRRQPSTVPDGSGWNPLFGFIAGVALPWLLLAVYLSWSGGWQGFSHYFWEVPSASGRLKTLTPWALRMVIKAVKPEAVNSTFAYMLGPALRELVVYGLSCFFALRWWQQENAVRRFWLASAVFLLLQQQWSYNTSNNNESLYWPYLGLLFGLIYPNRRRAGTLVLVGLLLASLGFGLSATRRVHDLKPSALGPRLEHPRLSGLRLYPQEGEDFAALVAFIEREIDPSVSFFVLGDPSLLYGITGHTPPRGLLWYRDGVSYLAADNAAGDTLISDPLISHPVDHTPLQWVIVDAVGRESLMHDFPNFQHRLETQFQPPSKIGSYRIYRREQVESRIFGGVVPTQPIEP